MGSNRDHQTTADADAHPDAKGPLLQGVGRLASSRRLVLGLVGGALVLGTVFVYRAPTEDPGTRLSSLSEAGQPVTEFALGERGSPVEFQGTTLTDEKLAVSDLRGNVVVINVWGSWCPPCREEAPVLARASQRYANQGVAFLGINVRDNRPAAVAFEESYGITYPSIEDPDGRALLALTRYVPTGAVPATLVLDRDGRVAARVLGAVRPSTLSALLDDVVGEPTKPAG